MCLSRCIRNNRAAKETHVNKLSVRMIFYFKNRIENFLSKTLLDMHFQRTENATRSDLKLS